MTSRYLKPQALRKALEDRLKTHSRESGLPLDRLRKEAAFQRLLARIAAVAPTGSWALKGGQAMIARSGNHARATADADATWRAATVQLQATLAAAAALNLDDHFQFLIAAPTSMRGEGPDGAVRFGVQARLAGRLFEPLRLDINLAPDDPRPIEQLSLRNFFDFLDLPTVVVPAISPGQQLAEKLHAYTRDYGLHENTRVKDLYDMLLIATDLTIPTLGDLVDACATTFALRETPWPPQRLNPPPLTWIGPWSGFVRDYGTRFLTLDSAYQALTAFWQPALSFTETADSSWDSTTWTWSMPDHVG
jgi:hypothetical protein